MSPFVRLLLIATWTTLLFVAVVACLGAHGDTLGTFLLWTPPAIALTWFSRRTFAHTPLAFSARERRITDRFWGALVLGAFVLMVIDGPLATAPALRLSALLFVAFPVVLTLRHVVHCLRPMPTAGSAPPA